MVQRTQSLLPAGSQEPNATKRPAVPSQAIEYRCDVVGRAIKVTFYPPVAWAYTLSEDEVCGAAKWDQALVLSDAICQRVASRRGISVKTIAYRLADDVHRRAIEIKTGRKRRGKTSKRLPPTLDESAIITLLDQIEEAVPVLARNHKFRPYCHLRPRLVKASQHYLVTKQLNLVPTTPAQQKRNLDALQRHASSLVSELDALGSEVHAALAPAMISELGHNWAGILRNATWRLARASGRTLSAVPRDTGGAPRDYALNELLDELTRIYEQGTSKKAGLSRGDGAKHSKPRGPFFRFVKDCLHLIDHSPTDEALAIRLKRLMGNKTR